ncbi:MULTISPECIES: DUF7093 family protein [Haloarcula]|uniref:Uncharacterized protein n=3 Tax=Haloarcula TaxID=2237 RepID=A0A830EVP2_9EURY|nr:MULTISPECIES: hypothetical protein [Haloarcula]EMA31267.1 hypothetical protein C444_08455 [Haloarcula japonica DSM 6131]GGK79259.1 hypothetical protein GCM10009067_34420 [Haloarcula sebkhae]
MGMRCELFGHDFDKSKIEESYNERECGTILTVREYKSCQRCGHIYNISENQGLISNIEESKGHDGQSNEAEDRAETKQRVRQRRNTEAETEATDSGQRVEKPETTDTPEPTVAASNTVAEQSSDIEVSNKSSAVTLSKSLEKADDAVILSDSETQEPDDDNATSLNSDDAMIIDGDTDTAHSLTETSEEPRTGNSRGGSSHTADDLENTTNNPDPTYQCPRCEFELPASKSSFFTGDVCPQCRVGYLEDTSDSEL